jgi:hypothetical protein
MNGVEWKDLQRKWLHERRDVYSTEETRNPITPVSSITSRYIITPTTIVDGLYHFDTNDTDTLILKRNTTYIFDQSDPSNHGHALCISRHPAKGQVQDIGLQGNPGSPGALLSIYIGDARPTNLFYYDSMHRGRSGKIELSG